jgi:hypothetical protein
MVASLGYWLADTDVWLGSDRGREYRGLDRLPYLPGPDQDEDLRAREGRLLRARNRYWRLDDAGWLRRSAAIALELRDEFAAAGISLEVVRADLADLPDTTGLPGDLEGRFNADLTRWTVELSHESQQATPLGFDVTYPFPSFHSAIRQPVLERYAPRLLDGLNEAGLFPTLDRAQAAVHRCNATDTAWRPFCAIAISGVDG